MVPYLALALAFPVQIGALLALWDWSRFRSKKPFLVGGLGVATFAVLLRLGAPALSERLVAGFFGVYIFAALLWAWWRDGHRPADWTLGEALVAALAAGLIAIAASAA